ncbi:MAG: AMP-binding protein, partial [Parasporobacterium sp.]|nr:AMP-binding protein [Parasporobacterium sp.]
MEKYYDIMNCLQFLERSAERFPDKTAFADDTDSMTFSQMMVQSMEIGSGLKQFGMNKEPVAIIMDARHIPFLKAMMGVLYAGCYYIPLDPTSPVERIQAIFDKLNPSLVIVDEKAAAIEEGLADKYRFVKYDSLTGTPIDQEYLDEVRRQSNYYDLLFIMFTSGSTGVPKGVTHTHGDLIRYSEFTERRYSFTEKTVFGNQSPFYYANCLLDIYPPLCFGASVYVLSASLLTFPKKMVECLQKYHITELCMTPSSFNAVAEAGVLEPGCIPELEYILPSGEIANWKFMQKWEEATNGNGTFWNFYGSTELLSVALWKVDREFENDEIIPAGDPYRCTNILILDEEGNEVPRGEKGEMVIHNPWMFSGYYNDPERNEAAFVTDPLKKGWNETFFKTGDIGFINEAGQLVVVGRKDAMIKHKGYRMELGEVEYAAKGNEGVSQCACILDKSVEAGDIYLFYTGTITEKELKNALKVILPKYAMPEHIVHLDSMPYNANMKADRQALA